MLRMSNPWLENTWSHEFVESVHIRFKEPFGTEGRGGYFDKYNIIRDVLQVCANGSDQHLFYLSCLFYPLIFYYVLIAESSIASPVVGCYGTSKRCQQ